MIEDMKVVASARAVEFIRSRGGRLFVWLDPHRGAVGSYVLLDASTEPPRRIPKRASSTFHTLDAGEFELLFAPGRLEPPEELHVDLRGWRTKRVEAYWNGCWFVGEDVPPPGASS